MCAYVHTYTHWLSLATHITFTSLLHSLSKTTRITWTVNFLFPGVSSLNVMLTLCLTVKEQIVSKQRRLECGSHHSHFRTL